MKVDKIHRQDVEIRNLMFHLPKVAQDNFIKNNLIEELHHTNVLEGVRISREEIVESTRKLKNNPEPNVRLKGMINSYNQLLPGEFKLIEEPRDLRDVYNYLVADEIDDKNLKLDGEIFRRDVTNVYGASGTGQIIHKGVTPEERIIEAITQLIEFLNDDSSERGIPLLFKIAIGHYYFGYIHPFYDGNGRTSRFISSMYLQKEFNSLTALSLSKGCNKNKQEYLKAFEITNSFKNKGELTGFCDTFFDIIVESQKSIINELKENKILLDRFVQRFIEEESLENDLQKNILYVLTQNYFFIGSEKGLTRQELTETLGKSVYMIKKETDLLLDRGLLTLSGKRPIRYLLNEEYFNLGSQ